MTGISFSQDNGDVLFVSDTGKISSAQGESKKRRRKKTNGEGELRKRKLSAEQLRSLEESFGVDHNLETKRKEKIAAELGMDPQQVAVWFQNRRVRWKGKQLKNEYSKLQSAHECVVVEKSHLEGEVLRLRAELSDSDKEMKRLVERQTGALSCSQDSSSFSTHIDPNLARELGYEGYGNLFQVYDDNYISEMEWVNYVRV